MDIWKKAQTATEYLIILAVVIIIALIVVGVLGGIPGIGKGAASRTSAAYWQTSDIAIPSYAIGQDGSADDLNLTVRNNNVLMIVRLSRPASGRRLWWMSKERV